MFFSPDPASNFPGIEYEITRPAIKVADLTDQDSINKKIRRIIHPYKKIKDRWHVLEPDEFMDKYPHAYKYLKKHENILLKRDKGKGRYRFFYEWGRTQGMDAPGPKLLTKTFSRGPNFFLDMSDSLFCNGYCIKPGVFGLNLEILQKILNSIVMNYYSRLTSFQIGGNYQCFQKNHIQDFGIPDLNETNALEIKQASGKALDLLLCEIYNLPYADILETVSEKVVVNL